MKYITIFLIIVLLLVFPALGYTVNNVTNAAYVNVQGGDTNFGQLNYMPLRFDFDEGTPRRIAYIEIPSNESHVILSLYDSSDPQYDHFPHTIEVYSTSIFNENTLTWNNKPSYTTLLNSSIIYTNGWHDFDLNLTSKYIVISVQRNASETRWYQQASFESDESSLGYFPYSTDIIPTPTSDISGYVKNTAGTGLSGVTVTLQNITQSMSETTNSNGYYIFTDLTDGIYNYTVFKNNYTVLNGAVALSGDMTNVNYTLSAYQAAVPSSIFFFYPTYITGDVIAITAYSTKTGTVQLLDSKGTIKYTAPIAFQTTKIFSYTVLSSDTAGIWTASIKDAQNSIIISASAEINVPTIRPTPDPSTGCITPECLKGEWTIDDVFMWMRINIPTITMIIGILYIIALLASLWKYLKL